MPTEVLTALIGLLGIIIGGLITSAFTYKSNKVKAAADLKINESNIEAKDFDDRLNDILKSIQKQETNLKNTEASINKTLQEHRDEYLNGIDRVDGKIEDMKEQINDMKSAYQETVATVTIQIDNLQKETEKHNKVIERTYKLETITECNSVEIDNLKERVHHVEKAQIKG